MPSLSFIPTQPLCPPKFPRPITLRRNPNFPFPSLCAKPPQRSEPSPIPAPSTPQLARPNRPGFPILINRPEAVLGILLAAAALLADFTRDLVRIAAGKSTSNDEMKKGMHDIDTNIALLRAALDESKRALKLTEDDLDESVVRANTAEKALAGLGDSRDRLMEALDQAANAEIQVEKIQTFLREEREGRALVDDAKELVSMEMDQVAMEVQIRENKIDELKTLVEEVRRKGDERLEGFAKREDELKEGIEKSAQQVDQVKKEKERLSEEAKEMERRAATMAEQVSAAALALEETRRELERVEMELEERKLENERVERETLHLEKQEDETDNLRKIMVEMERELRDLHSELRDRDTMVTNVASESDELRSLLASRDAALREVSQRLASAIANEMEKGGDSKQSNLKLEEITTNLNAEQLAFSSEIAKANLAKSDLNEEKLDAIDRVTLEMDAEGGLLQAGLRKAEAAVLLEEHQKNRKKGAVQDVLDSIQHKTDATEMDSVLNNFREETGPPFSQEPQQSESVADASADAGSQRVEQQDSTPEATTQDAASGKSRGSASEVELPAELLATLGGEMPGSLGGQKAGAEGQQDAKQARRRGRPAKKTAQKDNGTAPPKRKRGRPKKSDG